MKIIFASELIDNFHFFLRVDQTHGIGRIGVDEHLFIPNRDGGRYRGLVAVLHSSVVALEQHLLSYLVTRSCDDE